MSQPIVRRTSQSELVFACPLDIAWEHVIHGMEKLGSVKQQDRPHQFLEGRIQYGLQSVRVRVSLVERVNSETTVVIQGSSGDVWQAGARNATNRLAETLANLDNPGYKPDRLGMRPAALVGLLIGLVLLLTLLMALVRELLN